MRLSFEHCSPLLLMAAIGFGTPTAASQEACPWDCGDGNGVVGTADLLSLLSQWGRVGASCDFDGTGVATADLLELLTNWGPCACGPILPCCTCTCYWDSDCTSNDCGRYGECTASGKLDGLCATAGEAVLIWDPGFDPSDVGDAADLYMQAYSVPVMVGEGRPDALLFCEAQKVVLGNANEANHEAIRQLVHEVLDAVLGFDFEFPQGDENVGNIRGVPPQAVDILEAARAGFVTAIMTENPDAVAAPLEDFWAANPEYHPNHTGRYYPHGHPGEPLDSLASQINALTVRVARILIGAT